MLVETPVFAAAVGGIMLPPALCATTIVLCDGYPAPQAIEVAESMVEDCRAVSWYEAPVVCLACFVCTPPQGTAIVSVGVMGTVLGRVLCGSCSFGCFETKTNTSQLGLAL